MRCPSRPLLFFAVVAEISFSVCSALWAAGEGPLSSNIECMRLMSLSSMVVGYFFRRRALVSSLRYCAVRSFAIIHVADSLYSDGGIRSMCFPRFSQCFFCNGRA